MRASRGFTLLELLVVIAIIGLLASISLAFLNPSREKSRNAAVLSQVYEYRKALDLYYTANGRYPSSWTVANRNRIFCIGDNYTGGYQCVPFSETTQRVSEVETVLAPSLIPSIQHVQQGVYSWPAYWGCSYICTGGCPSPITTTPPSQCTDQNFSLFYMLEGINSDCGRGIQLNPNFGGSGYTWCQISSAQ
jgi:prepilin-type N-terminal cleavage/methylation domain-containing protein